MVYRLAQQRLVHTKPTIITNFTPELLTTFISRDIIYHMNWLERATYDKGFYNQAAVVGAYNELAKELGLPASLTQPRYSEYANGKRLPGGATALVLGKLLDMEPRELIARLERAKLGEVVYIAVEGQEAVAILGRLSGVAGKLTDKPPTWYSDKLPDIRYLEIAPAHAPGADHPLKVQVWFDSSRDRIPGWQDVAHIMVTAPEPLTNAQADQLTAGLRRVTRVSR